MVQVDTAALRAAAKRLRDEAADGVGDASRAVDGAEGGAAVGSAFGHYGGHDGYRAVSQAWRNELNSLSEALHQLADAMETAADNYDRSDENARTRFGGGPR